MASLFLSYAHEDFDLAQKLYYALINLNHTVFFDKESLAIGNAYDFTIIDNIRKSDFAVFIISPDSCSNGSYCRTELKIMESNWPAPNGKLFPIWARETEWEIIPNYIKAVSILKTDGNLIAETIKVIQNKTLEFNESESITNQVKRIEITEEIRNLESNWLQQKSNYLIKHKDQEEIPTTSLATTTARIIAGSALFLIVCVYYSFDSDDFMGQIFSIPLALLAVCFVSIGILSYFDIKKKSNEYQEAERNYTEKRNKLLSILTTLNNTKDT